MKRTMILALAIVMTTGALYHEAIGQQGPPVPAEEQPEVLTRGPVNEAFAQPVDLEDQAGLVAPTAPPAAIDENPPDERPSGEEFTWVPGYWGWDSDRNGYIWVSGCWRAVPPGMSWVPGYWSQVPRGWQWVPGFWAPDGDQEIEYLPEPPALTNVEPPGPAPSPDRIWVPPCWYWYGADYIQRPGYWIAAQRDWVWVPSSYVRTPRGYVFAKGHWDYDLGRRGVLFAPIYFPRRVYERPGFSYALSIAVNLGNLQFGLFTRPQYSHYYFGDYYDSAYISIGIFPRFECERRHTWYDPIYVHDRWRHRRDIPHWEQHERREYDRRRSDKELRPPRTYREMEHRVSRMPASKRSSFEIAAPMNRIAARKSAFAFERSKPEARQQLSRHSNDVHKFVEERSRWESQGSGTKTRPRVEQRPPSARSNEMAPPVKRKAPEMRSSEPMGSAPAGRMHRDDVPVGNREKGRTVSRDQERPAKVSPHQAQPYQPDKVRVRTPPVSGGRQGGAVSRKGAPTWPLEEQDNQH